MALHPMFQRAAGLFHGVLAPLVLGEELHPVRPIGPRLASVLAEAGLDVRDLPGGRADEVLEMRRRRAERLIPVDALPGITADEWRLAAALNDILQAANSTLAGMFPGRHERLLKAAESTLEKVASPATVGDVVLRHVTFSRMPALVRVDTEVRWWTGSTLVRGEPPPKRLLAWPDLRRVETRRNQVPIHELSRHIAVQPSDWNHTLAEWLRRTPLTDIMSAGREEPIFVWHPATLQLVKSPAGAALARRVLASAGPRCDVALERATQALGHQTALVAIASTFLAQRREHASWSP